MKKIILAAALTVFSQASFSIVRTVSNDPNLPAQFNTYDAAYLLTNPGDTIYVHGSSTPYTMMGSGINKGITIIGPGFSPDKQYKHRATFSSSITLGVNNISIFGLNDQNGFFIAPGVSNCRISRCFLFFLSMQFDNINIFIDGCCFDKNAFFTLRGSSNTLLNCVLNNMMCGPSTQNCSIEHNTFLGGVDIVSLSNSWVANNVFNSSIFSTAMNNSIYNNLYPFGPPVLPGLGNVGSGNVKGTPVYTDYDGARLYYYYSDISLVASTAGTLMSTDGTDAGAVGGGNPYAKEGEVKTLPIIREMDIMSPVVPSPGNVNVHIRATQPK